MSSSCTPQKRARVITALAHDANITRADAEAMLKRRMHIAQHFAHEDVSEIVAHVRDAEDHARRTAYVETDFERRHIAAERTRGNAAGELPHFVVRWSTHGYVTKGQPNRKPYARDAHDADVQRWASRRAAERFLSLKDPSWAASCVIEEVETSERARDKGGATGRALGTPQYVGIIKEPGPRGRWRLILTELDDIRYVLSATADGDVRGVAFANGGNILAFDPTSKGYAHQKAIADHLSQWWRARVTSDPTRKKGRVEGYRTATALLPDVDDHYEIRGAHVVDSIGSYKDLLRRKWDMFQASIGRGAASRTEYHAFTDDSSYDGYAHVSEKSLHGLKKEINRFAREKGLSNGSVQRDRGCRLRLVPEPRRRGRAAGASSEMVKTADGTWCAAATFKTWKPREIARLPLQAIRHEQDLVMALRAVIGTDLTSAEHVIAIGVDQKGRIVSIADGSSGERSLCHYRATDLLASVLAPTDRGRVAAIFMGHNHPGGWTDPSPDDLTSQRVLACAFKVIGILDHVVVSDKAHTSLRTRDKDGTLFPQNTCSKAQS